MNTQKKQSSLIKKNYYEVALPLAVKNLIYFSEKTFHPGDSVLVPLKNKILSAVILKKISLSPIKKSFQIKEILTKDKKRKPICSARLNWLLWLAQYYQHKVGQVIHLHFLPLKSPLKTYKKKQENLRSNQTISHFSRERKKVLTAEQKKCLREIQNCEKKDFRVHLLHGVTGSGKTEIYFHLIEPALKEGKSVLILVPEIALTPQHIEHFSARFPGEVACFHSHLSLKQKRDEWQAAQRGEKNILIGPRSALFCPLPHLSWIILDEEHESHFKQEEKLKYHGRDAAIYLGKCLNIPVVLSSATPSLESWQNAQSGKYFYHCLKKRVFETKAPDLKIVDMKKHKKTDILPYWLSKELYTALQKHLKKKEQAALFLNRRGENSYVFCSSCGFHFSCANCDISLTQHQSSHLICHYCGFREEKKEVCPKCKSPDLYSVGVGTATVEKELKKLFPFARIARADRDEIKNPKQWEQILKQMKKKEVDILVGTQMIAKGLDFPFLNLVGLIFADQGLNYPDFRAAEKSFQLLSQMAGRSGRRKKIGEVILQSYNPSHPVIQDLKKDFEHFAVRELKYRKKHNYPPFGKLSLIRVQSVSSAMAKKEALKIRQILKNLEHLSLLGPAPAPHFRLRNKYRYHLLLKSVNISVLKKAEAIIINTFCSSKIGPVKVYINPDPVNMF